MLTIVASAPLVEQMRRPRSPRETMSTTNTSFTIPLKQTTKPVAFPADFKKHMDLEFAMRYLTEVTHATTTSSVYVSLGDALGFFTEIGTFAPSLLLSDTAVFLVWE